MNGIYEGSTALVLSIKELFSSLTFRRFFVFLILIGLMTYGLEYYTGYLYFSRIERKISTLEKIEQRISTDNSLKKKIQTEYSEVITEISNYHTDKSFKSELIANFSNDAKEKNFKFLTA